MVTREQLLGYRKDLADFRATQEILTRLELNSAEVEREALKLAGRIVQVDVLCLSCRTPTSVPAIIDDPRGDILGLHLRAVRPEFDGHLMPMPAMACAVCGLVLHRRTFTSADGPTQEWTHGPAVDHLTVAVPVEDIQTNFQCDFCMTHHARWVLPVERYIVAPGNINDGDWAACDDCGDLLRANDWDTLTTCAHRLFVAGSPEMAYAPRAAFERIYEQLRGHVVGGLHLRTQTS